MNLAASRTPFPRSASTAACRHLRAPPRGRSPAHRSDQTYARARPTASLGHQRWRRAHDGLAATEREPLHRTGNVADSLDHPDALVVQRSGPLQQLPEPCPPGRRGPMSESQHPADPRLAAVWVCLCGSTPIVTICRVRSIASTEIKGTPWRTHFSRGSCHAPIKLRQDVLDGNGRQLHDRSATTGDRRRTSQPEAVRDNPLRAHEAQRSPRITLKGRSVALTRFRPAMSIAAGCCRKRAGASLRACSVSRVEVVSGR